MIGLIPRARLAFLPGVIAAAAHAEKFAQISHRMLVGKSFDHSVTLFYTSDRMPIVFFRMSRWVVTRASSLRNCWISRFNSSGVSGTGASTGLWVGPYWRHQSLTFQTLTPNS